MSAAGTWPRTRRPWSGCICGSVAAYLRDYIQRSEFAELFFTESHGYSVLASNRTSDFLQSDEEWWRRAVADGVDEGVPRYDSSAAAVSLEYDVAIQAPRRAAPTRRPSPGRPARSWW